MFERFDRCCRVKCAEIKDDQEKVELHSLLLFSLIYFTMAHDGFALRQMQMAIVRNLLVLNRMNKV